MIYYISDYHLWNQQNIRGRDQRNFHSLEEMHSEIITRWNERVQDDDLVVVLGDLSNGDAASTNLLLRQLHGHIGLLVGNHDRYLQDPSFDSSRFDWIRDYYEMNDGKYYVVLCHYPVLFYNRMYRQLESGAPKTYMLYGHLHNSMDEGLLHRFQNETRETERYMDHFETTMQTPCHMINCFCMFSDYTPLTLEEWIENDRIRRENIDSCNPKTTI